LEQECEVLNRKILEYNVRAKDLNKRSEDLKKKKAAFRKQQKELGQSPKSENISSNKKVKGKDVTLESILVPKQVTTASAGLGLL